MFCIALGWANSLESFTKHNKTLTVIRTTFLPEALCAAAKSQTVFFVSRRFRGGICLAKYSSQTAIVLTWIMPLPQCYCSPQCNFRRCILCFSRFYTSNWAFLKQKQKIRGKTSKLQTPEGWRIRRKIIRKRSSEQNVVIIINYDATPAKRANKKRTGTELMKWNSWKWK